MLRFVAAFAIVVGLLLGGVAQSAEHRSPKPKTPSEHTRAATFTRAQTVANERVALYPLSSRHERWRHR